MAVRILEEHLVNKIAAGEVVERPASVVKELVENALDAGATELRLHLRAGGRNLIRVVDDGSGMDRTDAMMCLERHATSKIQEEEDLFKVATLGFRGEAIPSIASVSRFELLTRRHDAEAGTRLRVDGGKLMEVEPAGCAAGTEISVGSLFFNIPARRKFLRSVETELGHCIEAVTREALIRPHVDVEITHDDRPLLRCVRTDDARQRAADLLGPHGEALVPAAFTRGRLSVNALVSPVGVHRANPQGCSYLYVNGRFVKDMVLRRAVTQAYAGIVPKDRYPVVILDLTVPVEDVDVNVHPAKTEVRFQHAFELQAAVAEGLRTALQDHGIRRPVAVEARYRAVERGGEQVGLAMPVGNVAIDTFSTPFLSSGGSPRVAEFRRNTAALEESADAVAMAPSLAAEPSRISAPSHAAARGVGTAAPLAASPSARAAHSLLPVARFQDLRVIGQLDRTYILTEGAGELVIVDQHAAAERITLYRLMRAPLESLGGAQRLLVPTMIELPIARARALAANTEALAPYGLEISAMGGGSIAVHALPAVLACTDLGALLADVADDLAEGGSGATPADIIEHALATMACHTSIRAGQTLDSSEMHHMLVQLDAVDFSVCAHGRPVAIRIAPGELERRFHRA